MTLLRPLPRPAARWLSALILVAWVAQMGALARRAWSSSGVALAGDLAHYGSSAQWRGIYYRGDKIGFSVGQTTPTDSGYEMREDGRLQMNLLGSSTSARLTSRATVDRAFALQRFSFALDAGTGPTEILGTLDGRRLDLTIRTSSGELIKQEIRYPKGHVKNPMDDAEVEDKFRELFRQHGDETQCKTILQSLWRFEHAGDIGKDVIKTLAMRSLPAT